MLTFFILLTFVIFLYCWVQWIKKQYAGDDTSKKFCGVEIKSYVEVTDEPRKRSVVTPAPGKQLLIELNGILPVEFILKGDHKKYRFDIKRIFHYPEYGKFAFYGLNHLTKRYRHFSSNDIVSINDLNNSIIVTNLLDFFTINGIESCLQDNYNKINHLSYSSISNYYQCPKSFQFRYLLNKKEAFISIEKHIGISIHHAISTYFKTGYDRNATMVEYKKNVKKNDRVRVIKKNMSFGEYVFDGERQLKYFFDSFPLNTENNYTSEFKLSTSLDCGIRIESIIDLIELDSTGQVTIYDFKTGKNKVDTSEFMLDQLRTYAWMYSKYNDSFICCNCKYYYLKLRESDSFDYNCNDLHSEYNFINNVALKILYSTYYPANVSLLCNWCGYNVFCDKYNEHRN